MKFFVYTWNRVCAKSSNKTPFKLYGGINLLYDIYKPFESIPYVGISKQCREGKLEAKARRGILVGYTFKIKGYRVWIPETNQIVESIDASFDEISKFDEISHSSGVPEGDRPFSELPGE